MTAGDEGDKGMASLTVRLKQGKHDGSTIDKSGFGRENPRKSKKVKRSKTVKLAPKRP